VPDLDEAIRRRAADALRRRVRRRKLGVRPLELEQLVEITVVLGVVDRRVVEDVVLVRPPVEPLAERRRPG